jgi:hypothetical protein
VAVITAYNVDSCIPTEVDGSAFGVICPMMREKSDWSDAGGSSVRIRAIKWEDHSFFRLLIFPIRNLVTEFVCAGLKCGVTSESCLVKITIRVSGGVGQVKPMLVCSPWKFQNWPTGITSPSFALLAGLSVTLLNYQHHTNVSWILKKVTSLQMQDLDHDFFQ